MTHRLFEEKHHASIYQRYRFVPPEEIRDIILHYLERKMGMQPFDLAVDVGCGSGQGTVLLAPHFNSVVGTDVSPAQLEVALEHATAPNISYRQCPAEELPFADSSVDLVTAMTAWPAAVPPRKPIGSCILKADSIRSTIPWTWRSIMETATTQQSTRSFMLPSCPIVTSAWDPTLWLSTNSPTTPSPTHRKSDCWL
ncbi:ubiquinone biosynthesis O-methyltransferase-like isoform 2-T4 [Salvelinus alpinus]